MFHKRAGTDTMLRYPLTVLEAWQHLEPESRTTEFVTASAISLGVVACALFLSSVLSRGAVMLAPEEKEIPLSIEEPKAEPKKEEPPPPAAAVPKQKTQRAPKEVTPVRRTSPVPAAPAAAESAPATSASEVNSGGKGSGPAASSATAGQGGTGGSSGPIQLPEEATAPVALSKPTPPYPDEARNQGIEAVVVVKFVVTELGEVVDAKVLKGHDLFNAVVLETIRLWKFKAAMLDGKAIRVFRIVKIPFKLRE